MPGGVVWALRAQVGIVYVFAGLAKLNADWLGSALPLRLWLADRSDIWLIGPLLDEPWVAFAASWAAALFDCTIVFWLLWHRSRPWAYAALVVFHVATWMLFAIGVFPWVMIAAALIFFPPTWPRRLLTRLRATRLLPKGSPPKCPATPATCPRIGRVALAALAVLAVVQLALPLRHWAYPGDVRWTEEGYWGAWRVMLTDKAAHVEFRVSDPASGRQWQVGPEMVLTDWQAERAGGNPDLIAATAGLIADHYRNLGMERVQVYADAWVSMNGQPAQRIIDPAVDLAAQPRTLAPAPWIVRGIE